MFGTGKKFATLIALTATLAIAPLATAAPVPAKGIDAQRMLNLSRIYLRISVVLGGGGKAMCPQISRVNRMWGMTLAGDGNQGATIYLVRNTPTSHRWLVYGFDSERVPVKVAREFARPAPCKAAPWTMMSR